MNFILASKSPRRFELFKLILRGLSLPIEFKVIGADIDESIQENEIPDQHAKRLAGEKANRVASLLKVDFPQASLDQTQTTTNQPSPSLQGADDIILAADTIVVLNEKIFGKPNDEKEAYDMLQQLSGQEHQVITGLAVLDTKTNAMRLDHDTTLVRFKKLSKRKINDYIASKEPMDKAGAYGIQSINNKFVAEMKGSFSNVVGLPVEKATVLLRQMIQTP